MFSKSINFGNSESPLVEELERVVLIAEQFSEITLEDKKEIDSLVLISYPDLVNKKVVKSFENYFNCQKAGVEDGRVFFKWTYGNKIIGVCGYQVRAEDPTNTIWGSWFFVHPQFRNTRQFFQMGIKFMTLLLELGYEHLFIETTDNKSVYNMFYILEKVGFEEKARIPNFFGQNVDNVIIAINLNKFTGRNVKNRKSQVICSKTQCGMKGLFANKNYRKGELIFLLQGQIKSTPTRTSIQISKHEHIEDDFGKYINHHCNPSAKIEYKGKVVANRAINKDEEITIDYCISEDIMVSPFVCKYCGKLISGKLSQAKG